MPEPEAPPPTVAATPAAPRSRVALLRASAWALAAALLGLPLAAAVLAFHALHNEAGSAWLLQHVPGLQVSAPRGALLGAHFGAERLSIAWNDGAASVVLEGVDLRGARWRWWVRPGVLAQLQAESLTARRVQVNSGPSSADALAQPATLHSPLELQIARVEVGELGVDGSQPLRALTAALHAGAADGTQHRIDGLAFEWDRLRGSGRARIGTAAPFTLDAALDLQSVWGPPWQATASAAGPLGGFDLKATLRGEARAGRDAPSLDAQVRVQPFAAWPIGTLDARTHTLDLSALASRAPQTRLAGHAIVTSHGMGAPIGADVELVNTLPGRWNEGRLPLRQIKLALQAHPSRRDRVELPTFDLQFADAGAGAGRWSGSGVWQGSTFKLDTRMASLRPKSIDGRAAAMTLSGPLALEIRGLPSPATAGGAAPAAAPAASAPPDPGKTRAGPIEVGFHGQLTGGIDGAPQPVSLAIDGLANAQRLELRKLHAASGSARAELTASAEQTRGQRWHARSEGKLVDFDPVAWIPGPQGSAWRKGPHRLNARWKLDLALPDTSTRLPALQWLQTLSATGSLQVGDSLLAGVPLQAQLQFAQDPGAEQAQRSSVQGELVLRNNRLRLDGRGDPAGSGERDRWRVELHAAALGELAPLAGLHPALAGWVPRRGSIDATLAADGRWPLLHTEAEVSLKDLQVGDLSIATGVAGWRLDTGRQQPIGLQAELTGVAMGKQRLAVLRGDLRGTVASHRIEVDVAAPLGPPATIERMLGLRTQAGTQAQLSVEGGWERASGGGGTWRGSVHRMTAGVWDGSSVKPANADVSWLATRGLSGEIEIDPDGNLAAAHAAAGQATLAGGATLRWDDMRFRAGAQRADLELHAEVLPFAVAPLLQRAQAAVQWGGDLRLAARIDVRAGERVDADISVRRHDGDLQITENEVTQPLGLSDVELSLTAHDGVWLVKPLVAGRFLGTLSGAVTARAQPQHRWPDADAAIEGALHVQVPRLAVWQRWMPPGWRIRGEVSSTALLGGRFGAPEYTGELRASGVEVRNLLQGVEFHDGEMLVALKGDTARIATLSVRGGDGTITAEGEATFGSAPAAELKVKADRFRVLGRIDRQLVASGNATLSLRPDRVQLDGRMGIDSGLFDLSRRDAPTLDADVTVRRDGAAAAAAATAEAKAEPAAPEPRIRGATVAVEIDLGDKLLLRGRGIDTKLKGRLKVSTPGGRLSVTGTVSAQDGTYAAYGQKLEIERGLVAFSGPVDNPRLDILALRPNLDLRVGVAITGNALNPRIKLHSEPDMSETEKLSWLVLGRGADGLERSDSAILQTAALALLAGEDEGPTDKVLRSLGIDQLSVRQTDGEVRDTVITVGKQLTRNWYVGYERGVNATAGAWQITYRIAQRFTLRAQTGDDTSLDLIWTWRYYKP